MIFKNKKAIALSQSFGAILAVVLIGVLVIIGIFLFVTLETTSLQAGTPITNETIDLVAGGGSVELANGSSVTCGSSGYAITLVVNATDDTLDPVSTSNYTVSGTGVFSNLTETDDDWNVSYTFNWGGDTCVASQSLVTQFATYPALVGLVGTIVFLGLVIGVLVASFLFGGKGRV